MSPAPPSVEALPTLAANHARPSASDTPSLEKEPLDYDIEKDPGYSDDASDHKNLSKVAEVTELTPAEAFDVNVEGDESPFPEVNASVSTSDDPTIQINNFRMWFFVTLTTIIFAGCNMFFSLRYPSLSIGYTVAQILVHPLGRAWASVIPDWKIGYGRFSFRLNPGPWNMKEHGLVALCVNLTGSSAYAAGSLVAMTTSQYWDRKQDFGPAFGVLYILTTQMLGFGLAGLARRIIVYPAAMIWPSALPSTALFRALHEPEEHVSSNGWRISRYRFFCAVALGSFVWFWFPDYIWQSLSTFAFACYIAPNNQKVNTVFGMNSGLGLIPISFDWTQITYAGQPLTTPFYITANCWAAIAVFFLGVAPILYYKNVWHSGYLPILSSSTFDNTGAKYNVTRVMTDNVFDLEKYRSYSPMYISMAYSLSYCLNFAAKQIWARLRNPKAGGEDIHQRLMRAYKEVPDWWYATLALVVLGLGIFTIRYWDTQLPVWGFIVVTWGMGLLLIVPEGILQGTTNQRVFLNIITELIAGYAWHGKPIANMMVKMCTSSEITCAGPTTFSMLPGTDNTSCSSRLDGYNSVKHGLDFAQDLKLVSYLKIPPRTAFAAQIYASVLSCVVQVGVLTWMQGNIKDLCSPTNANRFTCQGTKVVHNASVIWGTIGPQRMFAAGETYSALLHFFWIGPVVTVLFYAAYRRWPRSWLRYVNVPIFFNSAGNIPPASCAQYSLWFITGFVFNYAIRRRAFLWWKKYNYLLSAALDTGTALATIIIFFALSYHGIKLVWWGNEVNSTTMDGKSTPWLTVAKGDHFGRSVGDF